MTVPHELPELNQEMLEDVILWAMRSYLTGNEPAQVDALTEEDGTPLLRTWRQNQWSCGTACCIAGAAILMGGWKPLAYDDDTLVYEAVDSMGLTSSIESAAENLLGLTNVEAANLFNGGNWIEDVLNIAHRIADARGLTLNLPSRVPVTLDELEVYEIDMSENSGKE